MSTELIAENVDPDVLPPEVLPNAENLVTEDDTPVDNLFSEKQQRILTRPLYSSWNGPNDAPFVAMANVGLFMTDSEQAIVPDTLLSLDVKVPSDPWPKENRSYMVWKYGKSPDVVIEIVSNRVGGEDDRKVKEYARRGVPYYVVFDPQTLLSETLLRAWRLDGGAYTPLDEPFDFPRLAIGLRLWDGTFENIEATWLRWVDANGDIIPLGVERVDAAEKRAHESERRADESERRAERLADLVRKLGGNPDAE